jgi:AcrR family transcriptional regulator
MAGTRQFDEDAVLAAALEVFWRKGLSATSMIDLAEATGVQRGSLYNAYGDKERLFLLAFDRYATRFLESARRALAAPEARRALNAFFDAAIANMTSGSPSRGCLTTKTATEMGRIGPGVEARVKRLLDDLQEMVATALRRKEFRGTLSLAPNAAAEVVVTFTRGLAVMERVHGDRKRLKHVATQLVSALCPRIKPAEPSGIHPIDLNLAARPGRLQASAASSRRADARWRRR